MAAQPVVPVGGFASTVPSFQVPAIEVEPTTFAVRMLPMPQLRTVFLGRLPPIGTPTLRLQKYIPDLMRGVPPPAVVEYSSKALPSIRLVYGNNKKGNCVVASGLHGIGVWSGNDTDSGGLVLGTEAEAIAEYHRIGGPGDNGLNMQTALEDFRRYGWLCGGKRYKIDGYVSFDPASKEQTQVAILLFGGGRIGFNVPKAWMDDVREGAVWDTPGSMNFVGGHDVRCVGFSPVGVQVSTWGLITTITWRAFMDRRIVEEAYIELAPLWYNADKLAPSGFDVEALKADLAAIDAGQIPPWQPVTPPVPPMPPVPTPGTWPDYSGTLTFSLFGYPVTGTIRLKPVAPAADVFGVSWWRLATAIAQLYRDWKAGAGWDVLYVDVLAIVAAWTGTGGRMLAAVEGYAARMADGPLKAGFLELIRAVKKLVADAQAGASWDVLYADFLDVLRAAGFTV